MEWAEPVLLRYDFEVGLTRSPATVCLGFPQRIEDVRWTCAFQFQGVGSRDDERQADHCHRVTGYSGLEALIEASSAIRTRLAGLVDARAQVPYELIFPRFLPTSSWFHLYDWAKELIATETERRGQLPSAQVEPLSRTTWNEPTLLHIQFKFVGRRKVTVRLGFPTFSQGSKRWTCPFQLHGVEDRQVKKVFGENGLLAVANAADVVRASLDQIGAAAADRDSYELTFPVHLPTEYGLEVHRRLSARISAEMKRTEQENEDKKDKRAISFNQILAQLAPSARL
jgi:hypothetical protein